MKKQLFLLALILCTSGLFAQKVVKTYYDYYNLKLKEEYLVDKNGFRNGYYKEYHPNRQLAAIGQYLQDKKTGLWKDFDETGKLWSEANYKAGELHGINKIWRNGIGYHFLSAVNTYNMGKQVGQISYYDKSLQMQWDVKSTGENKYWYKNGKLAKVWFTKDEKIVPLSTKIYRENGEAFVLTTKFRDLTFEKNVDLEFSYSKNDFEVVKATKYTADSLGWKIVASWADGGGLQLEKTKGDTTITTLYILKENYSGDRNQNFFSELKFLSDSGFYPSKIEYSIGNDNSTNKSRKNSAVYYNGQGHKTKEVLGGMVNNSYYKAAISTQWNVPIAPFTATLKSIATTIDYGSVHQTLEGKLNEVAVSFVESPKRHLTIFKNNAEIFRRLGQISREFNFAYQELPIIDKSPFSYLLESAWVVFAENGKEVAEVLINLNNRNWNQDPIEIKIKTNGTELAYVFSNNGVLMTSNDVRKLFSDADQRFIQQPKTSFFTQNSFNLYDEFLKLIEPYKLNH